MVMDLAGVKKLVDLGNRVYYQNHLMRVEKVEGGYIVKNLLAPALSDNLEANGKFNGFKMGGFFTSNF